MTIDSTLHVVAGDNVIVRDLGGETVLVNLSRDTIYSLDATGTHVWEVLTAAPSIQDAYETLSERYDVDPTRLRDDVQTFLNDLLDHGLLKLMRP